MGNKTDDPVALPELARRGERILKDRERRAQFFDKSLFGDPAWEILLDLFVAEARGKRACVSAICNCAGVPYATALRWIGMLERRDMIRRMPDQHDRRRVFLTLSEDAFDRMRRHLASLSSFADGPTSVH